MAPLKPRQVMSYVRLSIKLRVLATSERNMNNIRLFLHKIALIKVSKILESLSATKSVLTNRYEPGSSEMINCIKRREIACLNTH